LLRGTAFLLAGSRRQNDLNSYLRVISCSLTGNSLFFSTTIEPSDVNPSREATVFMLEGQQWNPVLSWRKDRLPMKYFQYGNVILPGGENSSGLLAVTPIAVEGADLVTSLWRLPAGPGGHA